MTVAEPEDEDQRLKKSRSNAPTDRDEREMLF
jgi:hypothetical protein